MKRLNSILLILLSVIFAASCSKDDPSEGPTDMLTSGVWTAQSVQHGTEGDLTNAYADFSISFKSEARTDGYQGSYVAANGGAAFYDTSGLWKFKEGSDNKVLTFDNGIDYFITLTESQLTMDFTVTTIGGRVKGLTGEYSFTLVK